MKTMRLLALLALWPGLLIPALLSGCGGGSGSGDGAKALRSVTIQIRWPASVATAAAASKATRVVAARSQTAYVEFYNGATRYKTLKIAAPAPGTLTTSTPVNLPAVGLTCYANVFAETAAGVPDYVTDPQNGRLTKGPLGGPTYTPLTPADPHPLSHAVTSISAGTAGVPVRFTLDNAIARLEPLDPNPDTATGLARTTISLDAASVDIASRIQAKSDDGANVLLPANVPGTNGAYPITAVIDPTDTLGKLRGSVDATGTQFVPNATGTVKLIVSDNEVNAAAAQPEFNQQPIQAQITFLIVSDATTAPSHQRTLTLDAAALAASVPFYAKSVTFTLEQNPLAIATGTPPLTEDAVPAPAQPAPFVVTPVYNTNPPAGTLVTAITLPTVAVPYTDTGRTLKLTTRAWSNADGTGTLLAQNVTAAGIGATVAPITIAPADVRVTGFAFTPSNPTITLTTTTPPAGTVPNTLDTLQVFAVIGDTFVPIDPRTVTLTSGDATIAAVGVLLNGTVPLIRLTGIVDAHSTATGSASTRTVPIVATDRAGKTGQTTLTVQRTTPGFGFN